MQLGATIMGPRNVPLERENPDLLASPDTDAGTIPNLKFSFADAHNRLLTGGWAREVTARELPIATDDGRGEHAAQAGRRSASCTGTRRPSGPTCSPAAPASPPSTQEGRNFIDDVGVGDLWNFPAGLPHSIQALADGCEFLLVFDNGDFSENETFLITDWFDHTPREVLAKNFGVPRVRASPTSPSDIEHKRYIFAGEVPPAARHGRGPPPGGPATPVPTPGTCSARSRSRCPAAGCASSTRRTSRPPSTIAAALVEIEPGAMRELHWHPNADEWQYYIAGQGTMTVFASGGKARTFDYQAGDVGYVPFAMGHYIENTGERAAAVPRDVPQRPLRRRLAGPVAGADPARTRPGPPEPGPVDHGRDHREQGEAAHRPVGAIAARRYRLRGRLGPCGRRTRPESARAGPGSRFHHE